MLAGSFIVGLIVGAALVVLVVGLRRPPPARDDGSQRRVSEIAELAGGLAHEIRNPLSTLMLNLKLLAEDLGEASAVDSETVRRGHLRIETIRAEAGRLQHLLDDFLGVVGPYQLRRTVVDLNEVVRRVVEFFGPDAEGSGVQVRAGYAPQPVLAEVDARLIEQALLNLLINGQQAMPDGGELIVRCQQGQPGQVLIEVCDTGVGIEPQDRDKIFRAFYSTKASGSGLGLSTTHRIVTEHGGSIQVESEPGRGTRFVVQLPVARVPS